MKKFMLLSLLIPLHSQCMENLFSLDADPREVHSSYEEPLWKQTAGFAWTRTKNHTGAVAVAAYQNKEAVLAVAGIGIAAAKVLMDVPVDMCLIPGEDTFHFYERPLEFSQHELDVMNGKPVSKLAAIATLASLVSVGTVYEVKGVYDDVQVAKKKRTEFLATKEKATEAYITHQAEVERMIREEQERQAQEKEASESTRSRSFFSYFGW